MYSPHPATVCLLDGDEIAFDPGLLAHLGEVPDLRGDVATDRADILALQLETNEVLEFVEPERPFHVEFVLVELSEFGGFPIELVLNVAHQLLEHVVEGHDSGG